MQNKKKAHKSKSKTPLKAATSATAPPPVINVCVMLDGNPMFLLSRDMLNEIRVSRSRGRKNERPEIARIMNNPRRKRRTKLVREGVVGMLCFFSVMIS